MIFPPHRYLYSAKLHHCPSLLGFSQSISDAQDFQLGHKTTHQYDISLISLICCRMNLSKQRMHLSRTAFTSLWELSGTAAPLRRKKQLSYATYKQNHIITIGNQTFSLAGQKKV